MPGKTVQPETVVNRLTEEELETLQGAGQALALTGKKTATQSTIEIADDVIVDGSIITAENWR